MDIQNALIALEEKRGLAKDTRAQSKFEKEGNNLREKLRESLGRLQGGQQDVGTTFLAFSPALDISVLRQVYITRHADSFPSNFLREDFTPLISHTKISIDPYR